VGELHHAVHPVSRARLQQTRRRADGPPAAAAGLADPDPRAHRIAWLAFAGLLMAIGTLSVISWAEHTHGIAIARTMGMVTFALYLLFFSIESKDDRDSARELRGTPSSLA
jgi:hypothetical protein